MNENPVTSVTKLRLAFFIAKPERRQSPSNCRLSVLAYTGLSGELVMEPGPVEMSVGQQLERHPIEGNVQHYWEDMHHPW